MENELLHGGPKVGPGLSPVPRTLEDAATKGLQDAAEDGAYLAADGKHYPQVAVGLAAFGQDGHGSHLAYAIWEMRRQGVFRAWTGGKAHLSNEEIATMTVAQVAAAPRSGPLLVLSEWDTAPDRREDERKKMMRQAMEMLRSLPGNVLEFDCGPDDYRFELADPGTKAACLAALRLPTEQEKVATSDSWYADRQAAQALAREKAALEVPIDPHPPRDGVTVYTENGCRGKNRHFFEGSYSVEDLEASWIGNDTIASISVGWKDSVTLYSDPGFSGVSKTFQGNNHPNSHRYDLPADLRKKVSSMKVHVHYPPGDPTIERQVRPGFVGKETGWTLLNTGRYR
ncbi:hypothetical protein OG264_38585 (plasmid) [Streptomyces xanthophaeus]|uniref:hypothetical protein n=1 Tax=Streptomyces xanthophaeus TaxID=67385 RepID=UPI002F91627A|nr:hypothetical protein OG264_38585 [Streptomyces xanthophaeus]WST65807.1 hypothetical protein OG605_40230 [Streptomyces xanthophaeus]